MGSTRSGEGSSGLQTSGFLLNPRVVGRAGELCETSFIRARISFMQHPPSWPKLFPKAPVPTTITLGTRYEFITYEFGDDTNIQMIACLTVGLFSLIILGILWAFSVEKLMTLSDQKLFSVYDFNDAFLLFL